MVAVVAARYDGLIRVSRVRGRSGDSFISPDVQRQQINGWAAMRRAEIIAWHEDLDESGSKADRPGLVKAIERIEQGATDGIVVAKLDRFFRSLPLALEAIKRIDAAGGEVISVADGVDPGTPIGRMMRQFLLSIAEWQFAVAQENWLIARERAVMGRGVHIASKTPTGYMRRENGVLEPHPDHGGVISEAFALRAAGGSWRDLCDLLNARGVVGPYEARQWTTRAATHMIANRVYLGEARSGEFVNPDAHEPLVDRALWEAAQRGRGRPAQRSSEPYLLAGLLRCAGCRYALKTDRMSERDGKILRMYRCRGNHASGNCTDRASTLARVIEPWVEEQFLERAESVAQLAGDTGEIEAAEKEVAAAEADLAAYRDDPRVIAALGPDRFVDGLNLRVRRVDQAHVDLAAARDRANPAGILPVRGLREMWPELPTSEKQLLLRSLIDAVMLRSRIDGRHAPIGERALILWRGEAPGDFPRRGFRPPLRPFDWPESDPPGARVAALEDADERGV